MSSAASSYASSSHGGMASKLRVLALGSKPYINIELDNEREVYSTMDRLSGKVEIAVTTSTRFEDVEIQFIGSTKTYLEKMATSPGLTSSTSAFHQFLKLRQPTSESCYPQPRIFEPGRTYEFPFLFVIPQHLLPRVCKHEVHHRSVHEAHIHLPPSLGVTSKINDFAPDMTKIHYQIAARITAHKDAESCPTSLASKMKTICVVPTVDEQPPVNVQGPDSDYLLRNEKNIKKGVFKGKLGSLVVEAEQPKSLCLPNSHNADTTVSTAATLKLRFDPAEKNSPPPRLGTLASKLKVSTWFSTTAQHDFPSKRDVAYDYRHGLHYTCLNLSSRCMGSVDWTFHEEQILENKRLTRQDSATSILDPCYPSPSEKYKGNGFYTAEIVVPVALPKGKHFVPTFHSCLVSRTYALNLSLGIHSSGVSSPSIDLKIPIQVSAEGISEEQVQARTSLTAEQQEEQRTADEFFVPGMANTWTNDDFMTPMLSSDLPPEYEAFARPLVGVAG